MKILKWIKQIKDFFSGQKKTTISVNGNSIHKEKDVMNIGTESGNITIEHYYQGGVRGLIVISIVFLIVFLVVIVAVLLFMNHDGKSVARENISTTRVEEKKVFENQYVYGNYDGLIRYDNATTTHQKCDTEFYISEAERNKGNYIRALAYPSQDYFERAQNYESEDEQWSYVEDIVESVCIYLCLDYDAKPKQALSHEWRYIKTQMEIYISTPFFVGEKDYINTIVNDREKSDGEPEFVLQKCLYFGEDEIIVVVLHHEGTYEQFMENDSGDELKLKHCFQSFYQTYY